MDWILLLTKNEDMKKGRNYVKRFYSPFKNAGLVKFEPWWRYICIKLKREKIFGHHFLVLSLNGICLLKSLPNDKILEWNNLKVLNFADNNINITKMKISVFDTVGNIVGKGENASYQHFLLFLQFFQKSSLLGLVKVRILWYRLKDK